MYVRSVGLEPLFHILCNSAKVFAGRELAPCRDCSDRLDKHSVDMAAPGRRGVIVV